MDLLYVTNPGSADLRWGSAISGGLTNIIPLGFAGNRIVAMPGQRYLYITGNKTVNNIIHAWLAVVDTCTNTVIHEEDLGVGFGGQCAVPQAMGGNRAYVAISQAVGSGPNADTGPDGGSNRVEALDVSNPAAPVRLPAEAVTPTSFSPWGFLHIVWAYFSNSLYVSHRGDHMIFYYSPQNPQNILTIPLGTEEPMGLGISNNGLTLFVARRDNGDIIEVDLTTMPPAVSAPIPLPYADTDARMHIAVAPQDRVLVTSDRDQDGFLNIYHFQSPPAPQPQIDSIDTMGTSLGQPGVNPDATVVYVPRGDQNDVAQIDFPNLTLFPMSIPSGIYPTDLVVLRHEAGLTLQVTPPAITAPCNLATQVEVRAFDACAGEMLGVPILATTTNANISLTPPGMQPTPAVFTVVCSQAGMGSTNFTAGVFPFITTSIPVQCTCAQQYCYDFTSLTGGPLPLVGGVLAGAILVEVVLAVQPEGPRVEGSDLRMFQGRVRFQVTPGFSLSNLIISGIRHDRFSPQDEVHVTHSGIVTPVSNPNGLTRGTFTIVCPFTDITEWVIYGGHETWIQQICFSV